MGRVVPVELEIVHSCGAETVAQTLDVGEGGGSGPVIHVATVEVDGQGNAAVEVMEGGVVAVMATSVSSGGPRC